MFGTDDADRMQEVIRYGTEMVSAEELRLRHDAHDAAAVGVDP